MPKQTPAASDYTALLKSSSVANDMASNPRGSPGAAKSAKAAASANRGSLSLGVLSSIITQSAVGRSIIPRPITTSSIPLPISETGLVLWLDAKNLSSMVFGDNRTLGTNSYRILTSIKDSYKGIIGSVRAAPRHNDPVYVPSVNTAFLTDIALNPASLFPTPTNNPAFYFRGYVRGEDSHLWTINQYGKPTTMFAVWHNTLNTPDGGSGFGSKDADSSLMGYGYHYDYTAFYDTRQNESVGSMVKAYTSYKTPVTFCLANRMNGSTKQIVQRLNGVQTGITNINSYLGSEWYHNPNVFRTGRNNGDGADIVVYEVLIYNVMMSDSEIQVIESYLKKKWNL